MTDDAILNWLHDQLKAIPVDIAKLPYETYMRAASRQKTLIEVRNFIWARQDEEAKCERTICGCRTLCSEGQTSGTPFLTPIIGELVRTSDSTKLIESRENLS